MFYLTGLGAMNPALGTGVGAGANSVMAPGAVAFGTANGVVEYAGAAPGFVGRNQINVRIPPAAPTTASVPVSISVGGRQANPVIMAIGQ